MNLREDIELTGAERTYWDDPGHRDNLPFKVNSYYAGLIEDGFADPIRRQVIPLVQELNKREYENADPLGEGYHNPLSRLIHQYPDRVLLKVTDRCAVYCRHCFRRSFSGGEAGDMTLEETEGAAAYLQNHPEVREILLSGGDGLALPDAQLALMMDLLESGAEGLPGSSASRRRTFRICTRMPVTRPERITDELITLLAERKPVWVATQFNHPRELTSESCEAVGRFIGAGIPVVNQAVLLRGVNDEAVVLAELFQGLVAVGVKPLYLFQGDLAAGTAHLRVGLKRGLALVKEVRHRVSGLAMPVYAVDLPNGGGKVVLTEKDFLRDEDCRAGEQLVWESGPRLAGWRVFEGPGGREYRYPLEIEENKDKG